MGKSSALKYILFGALVVLLVLLFYFLNPENHQFFPQCPIYKMSGLYCSGCGSQRALHDLLHLDFKGAFGHNLLIIPSLLVLLIDVGQRFYNPKKSSLLQTKGVAWGFLIVIVLFMVLRNIDAYPFTLLAP